MGKNIAVHIDAKEIIISRPDGFDDKAWIAYTRLVRFAMGEISRTLGMTEWEMDMPSERGKT